MSRTQKLTEFYKQAHQLNEDNPKELMDKLSIYGRILELIGGLYADAFNDWGAAESERREIIANAIGLGASMEGQEEPKTDKQREAVAEIMAKDARKKEKKYESEKERWRKAYDSTVEQIQIMKKKYDHLVNVSKGGV